MIVVTGPGRSGTSVLAQFCRNMGFDPGGVWYDWVDAGLEHPRVVAINEALQEEARRSGTVSETLARYAGEMRSLDLAVVKDPRFTFDPAILRAWRSVRPDLKVIMTYRNPNDSIASRKRHPNDLIHDKRLRPDELRCDLANTVETMLDLDIPFALLLFPHFLDQYDRVYHAFCTLGLEFDREEGRQGWAALVNMDKVHFRPAADASLQMAGSTNVQKGSLRRGKKRLSVLRPRLKTAVLASALMCLLFTAVGRQNATPGILYPVRSAQHGRWTRVAYHHCMPRRRCFHLAGRRLM